jgi:hypothetical protein
MSPASSLAMISNGAMAKPMVAAARMSGMSTSPVPRSAIFEFDLDVSTIFSWYIFPRALQF